MELVRELEAAFFDGMIEVLEGLEGAIGDGLVGERPEAFCGLRLGAVGRQVSPPDIRKADRAAGEQGEAATEGDGLIAKLFER